MAGRDVVAISPGLEAVGNSAVVPRLVVIVHAIDASPGRGRRIVAREDDARLLREDEPFDEARRVWGCGQLFEARAKAVDRVEWLVVKPDVRLDRNDAEFHACEEAQRTVGTGQGVKEILILVARGTNYLAVGGDDLEGLNRLKQAAVAVAAGRDPDTHAQAAESEIIHLGLDGKREPSRDEIGRDVAHGDHWLGADDPALLVNFQDAAKTDGDLVQVFLEFRGAH